MTIFLLMIILFFCSLLYLKPSLGQEQDCPPVQCRPNGPVVRFPFHLKDRQPHYCDSYNPSFTLSCDSNNNDTMLFLPDSFQVYVTEIIYSRRFILVKRPDNCFTGRIQYLNLSASSFTFSEITGVYELDITDLDIFSCAASIHDQLYNGYETCLTDYPRAGLSNRVYAFSSSAFADDAPILSCKKMNTISRVPFNILDKKHQNVSITLQWPFEICGDCELKGKYCRFKHKTREINEVECFGSTRPRSGVQKSVVVGLAISGLFLLTMAVVTACYVKKRKLNDEARIEKFLGDYRALKPSRYSYADIKKITNDFEDKVGQGSYGTVYKGTISKSDDVHVAVKMLNSSVRNTNEGQDFVNEMGIMGKIHHVNIVRLVGYCADGFRRALIYEFLPNGSMEKYILSDTEKLSLGWKKIESIAIGIAKGIEYLHQGCEQCILHFDIKPQNVLLDRNLVPKISDFGMAKLCSKEQSVVSMTTARGTIGYIAPEVFTRNFGSVSYKSDIYSFGMLLLGIVGGKEKNDSDDATNHIYYPEWIYNQLDGGKELRIQVIDDGDDVIVRKLAIVGLWCIQWYPIDRPTSMELVVQMLEGDGSSLVVPPNPFASMNSGTTRSTTSRLSINSQLEVIAE